MKLSFRTLSTLLTLSLLFGLISVNAQNALAPIVSLSPEKGLWIESKDGFMGMKLGIRVQQQLVINTPLSETAPIQSGFFIRRARLLLKGYVFEQKFNYFIQLGMDRGQVTLLNAEYRWKPNSTTLVSFGQVFPTTSRQFQTISKNFQMIDRSDVTRFFFTDWDLGIAFRKSLPLNEQFGIKVAASATHGEGKNIATAPGGWAYVGRLEILPFGMFNANGDYSESDLYREPRPKLSMGAAFYLNQDAFTKYGDSAWDGLDDNISEYYLDAVFKWNGFSLLGEYIHRSVDNERLIDPSNAILYSKKASGEGFYVQGGVFISESVEPVFRISYLNPNDSNQAFKNAFSKQMKYTAGLNFFLIGHSMKFQSQVGYIHREFVNRSAESNLEISAQFTISF